MSDYNRIRVLWPDHLGIARGKYLPARIAERGTSHCVSTFALGYDKEMTPAPGSFLLDGMPDLDARFDMADVRPGWEDGTGVVVADLSRNGEPIAVSSRVALQRAVSDWQALGYTPKVGIELEAYVCERDGSGGWQPWSTPGGYVYGTGTAVDPIGVIDDIMTAAEASELPVESINSEYYAPQFELTLEYGDAVAACDEAFLFRVLAREVAHRHGLHLTFLGRPFGELGGSGVHVNFSLVDGDGLNALSDEGADDGLTELTKHCLGGLCEHHLAMTALCAPTVNAYKRLRPAELSGYWANWGYDHRGVANRVPPARGAGTRIENRLADGAASLHTATATVLQAARLGVLDKTEPPPPESGDGLENVDTDVHSAHSLQAAIVDLEADTALVEAVGEELVGNFVVIKRAEWGRFEAAITDWETNEYLMFH